jgi:hypothetical protein
LNIPTSFYEFWKFEQFLGIKTIGKTIKIAAQRRASNRPTSCDTRPGGLPRAAGWKAGLAMAWQPSLNEEAARDTRKRGARRRGDALDGGAVGVGRRQVAASEHPWGPGVAPGRQRGRGAHPSGGSTWGIGAAALT